MNIILLLIFSLPFLDITVLSRNIRFTKPKNRKLGKDGLFSALGGALGGGGGASGPTSMDAKVDAFNPGDINDIINFREKRNDYLSKINDALSSMETDISLIGENSRSSFSNMNQILDSNLNKGNVFELKLNTLNRI